MVCFCYRRRFVAPPRLSADCKFISGPVARKLQAIGRHGMRRRGAEDCLQGRKYLKCGPRRQVLGAPGPGRSPRHRP
jgi:hypothetical protein